MSINDVTVVFLLLFVVFISFAGGIALGLWKYNHIDHARTEASIIGLFVIFVGIPTIAIMLLAAQSFELWLFSFILTTFGGRYAYRVTTESSQEIWAEELKSYLN